MNKKFIVLKNEDVLKHLNLNEVTTLFDICDKIIDGRSIEGKKNNNYIVINTDESYSYEIIEILKRNGHWG